MFAFIPKHASLHRIGVAVLSLAALLALPETSQSEEFSGKSMPGVHASAIVAQGYYMQTLNRTCPTAAGCFIEFSAVPSGKTLIVNYVSCRLAADGSAPATVFAFATDDNTALANLTPVFLGVNAGIRVFNTSDQVLQIVRAGKKPLVAVQFSPSATINLNCSIAGQLKP